MEDAVAVQIEQVAERVRIAPLEHAPQPARRRKKEARQGSNPSVSADQTFCPRSSDHPSVIRHLSGNEA